MANTRSLLEGVRGHLDESIGVRTTESRRSFVTLSNLSSQEMTMHVPKMHFGGAVRMKVDPD